MKIIPLTQGKFTRVSDEDYASLCRWKWCALKSSRKCGTVWYAVRSVRLSSSKIKTVYMHRELLPGAGQVDHEDGDGLNNQRGNIRPATSRQNSQNQRKRKGCSSIYKGVTWDKKSRKWDVQVRLNGRKVHLGRRTDEVEAAKLYETTARLQFGCFANFAPVVTA